MSRLFLKSTAVTLGVCTAFTAIRVRSNLTTAQKQLDILRRYTDELNMIPEVDCYDLQITLKTIERLEDYKADPWRWWVEPPGIWHVIGSPYDD